jgi:hypothetical protein
MSKIDLFHLEASLLNFELSRNPNFSRERLELRREFTDAAGVDESDLDELMRQQDQQHRNGSCPSAACDRELKRKRERAAAKEARQKEERDSLSETLAAKYGAKLPSKRNQHPLF